MNPVVRTLIVAIVSIATFYLTYWIPLALIPFEGYDFVAFFVAAFCAVIIGRYVWKFLGTGAPAGTLPIVLLWAAVVGGIGFVAGFFGPIVFAPGANQGPLLGIFITGPLGFLLGGIAGFIYAVTSRRKNESSG